MFPLMTGGTWCALCSGGWMGKFLT